ncbi:glutamate receptor ionotropic, delta-1-like [Tachypleus tridentatus]|uniref:glutamate receptor ionotropic, delta-1-like n=1 Tax=Tachypleus tridentatus TaxID=6853 RepID=UPI003FD4A329
MKMLVDKKVDIAGALFTKTRERMKAVSFTNTIFEDEIGILMKMPKRKDKSEALLAPFKPQVWLLIIVATISMGLVIYSILRLQSFMLELTNKGRKYRNGVLECLWLVYSGLVKQGVKEMANHDSVRILYATWWIFALVLTAFYTANLTAFLTSPEYKIYSSLKDALNDPKTKWLIENDSALEAALEINNDTTFEELRASRIKGRSETFSDFEEARKKVEKGGYIMLGEMYILNNMVFQSYIEHKRECVLTTGRFRFYKRPIGMPMPHETPFGEDFIKFIEQLRREGFIEKWKNMYFPVLESCLPSSSKTLETQQLGLTVSELSSALFMYVGGLLGSTAVVIAEMTLGKKFKCGKNPNVAGKMEKNTAKST